MEEFYPFLRDFNDIFPYTRCKMVSKDFLFLKIWLVNYFFKDKEEKKAQKEEKSKIGF